MVTIPTLPAPAGPPVVAAWLCLAAGLLLLLPGWRAMGEANAEVVSPGPLVVHADRHGQYVAEGAVEGVPARFLVDTGAAEVVIPAELARRAGLSRGEARRYRGVSGPLTAWRTRVPRLRVGPLLLRDVPAVIAPTGGSEVLLGMSVLRHLTLVQRQGRLVLAAE